MKIFLVISGLVSIGVMTVVPAIYDGQRTFRWGEDSYVRELADMAESLPPRIGEWQMVADLQLDETAEQMLRPIAFVNRVYKKGNLEVQVFLLLGPTGPTAVHTPDVCFSSTTFERVSRRNRLEVHGASETPHTMWQVKFRNRRSASGAPFLTSYYGWTANGTLTAETKPRYSFADQRHLIKLQVTTQSTTLDASPQQQELSEFLKLLCDEINAGVRNAESQANAKEETDD